ncbi:hypothetical protein [Puniceicoccus vermicola]|uniref:DUF1570 domain-containing protein n=1 Tax=Puniceicoccus vermicola TaxID=388746 RepID=A0A7X1E6A0_9BACT|nr:hypothetical protein [Puniceicoccus vermicola]MBC2604024.1 hypothetical protein [Puniceicoccus vermicola]
MKWISASLVSLLTLGISASWAQKSLDVGQTPQSDDKPQIFEGRAGTFEFVAADQGSLQIARKIGRQVLEVCDGLLTPPLERIPIITVKLAPDGSGNLEGQSYMLYQDIAGDYGLAIAWNENLSASLFTQVLTEAYLRQLVYTLSDRQRAEQVPAWLIAGANLEVQVGIRPALEEYLKELGKESEMVSLEEMVNKTDLDQLTPSERIASYWFLQLVTRQLGKEKAIRNYFDSIVAGRSPLEVLLQLDEEIGTFPGGIEGWWVIGFQDIVHRENGIVLPITRSAKQLLILDRFELIENGVPLITTSVELWDLRKNATIKQSITNRLRDIESILPRVNPVFYNAFRSLGLVFQSLLDGNEDEFQKAAKSFSEEVDFAANLARDAEMLSENPQAILPTPSPAPAKPSDEGSQDPEPSNAAAPATNVPASAIPSAATKDDS